MVEVKFYDSIDDKFLKFAVIISKTNGKWIFCKHKERDTYEVPGGHREWRKRVRQILPSNQSVRIRLKDKQI